MTAEEYYKQVINDFDQDYHDPETHPFAFAEAYHKAELERLVEEVDGVMVDITKGMYFDMVSAAAFRGSLLKIAGIE